MGQVCSFAQIHSVKFCLSINDGLLPLKST
jgi:hypothetical protein